jgi:hypothetical protein
MRKQVWYFKFNTTILGPVVTAARWAGRDYNPENLPSWVYKHLEMEPRNRGTRAILYPGLSKDVAYEKFCEQWPKPFQWNRVEIQPE